MPILQASTLAVRFLLEVAALGLLGWWGWRTGGPALGVALPVVAAVLWGAFAAPKASFDVAAARVAVQLLVLGGAALALAALRTPAAGGAFAAVAVVDAALLAALDL